MSENQQQDDGSKKKSMMALIISIVVIVAVLALVGLGIYMYIKNKNKTEGGEGGEGGKGGKEEEKEKEPAGKPKKELISSDDSPNLVPKKHFKEAKEVVSLNLNPKHRSEFKDAGLQNLKTDMLVNMSNIN